MIQIRPPKCLYLVMPRNPGPVNPRRKDEREYNRVLRETVLDPLFAQLRAGLVEATGLAQALQRIDASAFYNAGRGLPIDEIAEVLARVEGYHRARLIKSFRSALGVDIRPLLVEPPIQQFMARKVSENVDLIRTIPPRAHAGLKRRLRRLLEDAPFDRQKVTKALRTEYRVSGWNLRRIARDQTTKTIGGLTQVRHQQIGVEAYRWSTSLDERVRPTHIVKEGALFRWSNAPPDTGHPGHDIMCRCVAIPVILEADRDRLGAA